MPTAWELNNFLQTQERESLNTIFNHTTDRMSQEEAVLDDGKLVCLLPEMVSSLRKDLFFFKPEVVKDILPVV